MSNWKAETSPAENHVFIIGELKMFPTQYFAIYDLRLEESKSTNLYVKARKCDLLLRKRIWNNRILQQILPVDWFQIMIKDAKLFQINYIFILVLAKELQYKYSALNCISKMFKVFSIQIPNTKDKLR